MKSKRQRAKEVLIKYCFLISAENQPLYHGRAGRENEDWQIDPDFDNSGNKTGNSNIGKIPALYTTTDYGVAEEFATERAYQKSGKAQVYQILPQKKGCYFLNCTFDASVLSDAEKREVQEAKQELLKEVSSKYVPVKFEERKIADLIQNNLQAWTKENEYWDCRYADNRINAIVSNSVVQQMWNNCSTEGMQGLRKFVERQVKAHATKLFLQYFRWDGIMIHFLKGDTKIKYNDQYYYLEPEYIKAWAVQNGIIGLKHNIYTATLDKDMESWTIFGTEYVERKETREERKARQIKTYSSLAVESADFMSDPQMKEFFENASPEEIMRFVYSNPQLKEFYQKDAGNWERWSVASHTVAVVDFYQKNYQQLLPPELQAFMNVVLLTHDIGKGYKWEYGGQKKAHLAKSPVLYQALGVKEKYQGLIDFIITDSQEYTSQYYFDKSSYYAHTKQQVATLKQQLIKQFLSRCKEELKKVIDREPTEDEVQAIMNICMILQNSDSAAYTRFAKVKTGSSYSYAGNESFTKSFKKNKYKVWALRTYEDDMASGI